MSHDTLNRTTITLTAEERKLLLELGEGNMSRGVRESIGLTKQPQSPHKATQTMVYMTYEDKLFIKKLGMGNLSRGARRAVVLLKELQRVKYEEDRAVRLTGYDNPEVIDPNRDSMREAVKRLELEVPPITTTWIPDTNPSTPTTITQPPAHDDRPRRKPKPLIQPTATQSTSPTLPLPPIPPVSRPKRPPLTVLTPEQTARVHEYLGIPANTNPQPQIMCTVANSLWVQEYHNPTTGKLILEQEVSLNQFDPPL